MGHCLSMLMAVVIVPVLIIAVPDDDHHHNPAAGRTGHADTADHIQLDILADFFISHIFHHERN